MTENFEEGEVYKLSKLPDNEMNKSGKLEWVDGDKLGARYGDVYVTFEFESVRCTDVRHVDSLKP